jgi:hypothetical protein
MNEVNSIDSQQQRGYAPNADVYSQTLSGEAVLLDVRTGRYWGLDEIGTRIWELLERSYTIEAVIGTLSEEYHADLAVLAEDTRAFVETLIAAGLIVEVRADKARPLKRDGDRTESRPSVKR